MTDEQRVNAQKWIDALRSGRYEQGISTLRRGDKFCCLGVACDLYVTEHPNRINVETDLHGTTRYDYDYFALPPQVLKWLGLRSSSGGIAHRRNGTICGHKHLSGANDAGIPFTQIADAIEEQLQNNTLGLFAD